MNKELIQKLFSKSCWDEQAEVDIEDFISVEKFAELIVRECAEVAGCNGHVSGFSLGDLIKEHFGVRE
jgi:hypothetical protein